MSVLSELNRILDAKDNIRDAVSEKGVEIPVNVKLDGYASYINSIIASDYASDDIYILSRTASGNMTLPSTTHSIGEYCFANHTQLTGLNGRNVTSIGDRACEYCTSLTTASFNKLTSIGVAAFLHCRELLSISDTSDLVTISSGAFSECKKLVFNDNQFLNVKTIETGAFYACEANTHFNLPNAETVGSSAFGFCTGLTSISLPNIKTISGDGTFMRCTSLTSVDLGDKVTSIETPSSGTFYGMFSEVTTLTSFTVRAVTPPTVGYIFDYNRVPNIYVPAESVDAYKSASGWSMYASHIQAIPE